MFFLENHGEHRDFTEDTENRRVFCVLRGKNNDRKQVIDSRLQYKTGHSYGGTAERRLIV